MTHSTAKASTVTRMFSKEEIRDSTVRLIRTLVTLGQTLKTLPKQRFIVMKLQYRDIAPADYQVRYPCVTFDAC